MGVHNPPGGEYVRRRGTQLTIPYGIVMRLMPMPMPVKDIYFLDVRTSTLTFYFTYKSRTEVVPTSFHSPVSDTKTFSSRLSGLRC